MKLQATSTLFLISNLIIQLLVGIENGLDEMVTHRRRLRLHLQSRRENGRSCIYELMAGFELTEIERSSVLLNNLSASEKEN